MSSQLSIDAEVTYVFPDSIAVTGASIGAGGDMWFWTAGDSVIGRIKPDSSYELLRLGGGVVPVAVEEFKSGSVEILDGLGQRRLNLNVDTRRQSFIPFRVPGVVIAGERMDDGMWYLQVRDSVSQSLYFLGDTAALLLRVAVNGAGDGFSLGMKKNSAIISFRDPGHGSIIMNRTGVLSALINATNHPAVRKEFADTHSVWRTITFLPAGDEFLQTLAELRTGVRMLIAADSMGNFRRKRVLPTQLSFIASRQSQQRLIGARKLNHTELVLYRWRRLNTN